MDLSLIVCAYNMARELPRTLYTLSRGYQRGLDGVRYEILVVDNGSPVAPRLEDLPAGLDNLRILRIDPALPSPARALNAAVRATRGRVIGMFVDGARMVSPGLLATALKVHRADPTQVIGSLAFHLGPDVQMRSALAGYDQAVEDALLDSIPWREDGYSLFSKSVLAGSSSRGWFGRIAESNGVFLDRAVWDKLGGFDERFATPGGGYVNLDFWKRAVEISEGRPWMVLGEGTFHQIHGGAATNGPDAARKMMRDEYADLMGAPYTMPDYTAQLIGTLDRKLARRFGGFNRGG